MIRAEVPTDSKLMYLLPIAIVYYDQIPHDLRIKVVTTGKSDGESFEVDEAWFRYDDGETVELIESGEPMPCAFREDPQHPGSGKTAAYHRFEGAVKRVADFDLHVKGRLRLKDGAEREIVIQRRFNGTTKTFLQDFMTWTSAC
ncbi:MAG: hypothetical protein SH850_23930 [Planctomycetaceae bacterium]|nr:hypothetical protein [Planctomycetaceae bacterium]